VVYASTDRERHPRKAGLPHPFGLRVSKNSPQNAEPLLGVAEPRLSGVGGRPPSRFDPFMEGYAGGLERAPDRERRLPAYARWTTVLEREPFLVLVAALDAVLLMLRLPGLVAPDTWLGFVGGRQVSTHWLPRHDTLTVWTRGTSWVDQQWLGQVLLYGTNAVAGLRLVVLANVAVLVTTFVMALVVARRGGASSRAVAAVGAFAAFVMLPNTVVRTQTIAYLLFVAVFWLLVEDARAPSAMVFLTLPLLVLWANVHGSAVLGVGLVVLWAVALARRAVAQAERERRRMAGRALALGLVAPLCLVSSPYGLELPHYYRSVLANDALARVVVEWRSPTFPGQWPFFLLALVAIGLAARYAERLSLFEQLALLATLLAGLHAIRSIVWFALVVLMVLPRALDEILPTGHSPLRPRLNRALSLGAVLAVVALVGVVAARPAGWYAGDYPRAAADAVATAAARDPSLRVFSNEQYSDWLLWEVPGLTGRVAFDSRFELLRSDQLETIYRFRNESGPGWFAASRNYRLLVLDPGDEGGAVDAVLGQPRTRVLYRDRRIAVFLCPQMRASG
jgi:hypothetical protein